MLVPPRPPPVTLVLASVKEVSDDRPSEQFGTFPQAWQRRRASTAPGTGVRCWTIARQRVRRPTAPQTSRTQRSIDNDCDEGAPRRVSRNPTTALFRRCLTTVGRATRWTRFAPVMAIVRCCIHALVVRVSASGSGRHDVTRGGPDPARRCGVHDSNGRTDACVVFACADLQRRLRVPNPDLGERPAMRTGGWAPRARLARLVPGTGARWGLCTSPSGGWPWCGPGSWCDASRGAARPGGTESGTRA